MIMNAGIVYIMKNNGTRTTYYDFFILSDTFFVIDICFTCSVSSEESFRWISLMSLIWLTFEYMFQVSAIALQTYLNLTHSPDLSPPDFYL